LLLFLVLMPGVFNMTSDITQDEMPQNGRCRQPKTATKASASGSG